MFVKTHPTVLLELEHDIVCKLYLNKKTDPKKQVLSFKAAEGHRAKMKFSCDSVR